MTVQEAMQARHSVRAYEDRAVEPELREKLQAELAACNEAAGLQMKLVFDEPKAFSTFMARYEGLALLIFSVGIAFIVIGLPVMITSETGALSGGLFLPWWLYLSALAIVSALMLFICVLPAALYLRKTPVAILSKYDV